MVHREPPFSSYFSNRGCRCLPVPSHKKQHPRPLFQPSRYLLQLRPCTVFSHPFYSFLFFEPHQALSPPISPRWTLLRLLRVFLYFFCRLGSTASSPLATPLEVTYIYSGVSRAFFCPIKKCLLFPFPPPRCLFLKAIAFTPPAPSPFCSASPRVSVFFPFDRFIRPLVRQQPRSSFKHFFIQMLD